ncbi:hypothetical protein ACFV9C_29945 [Kribbella sp. NPDC059898]
MRAKLLTAVLALLAGDLVTLPARAAAPTANVVPIQAAATRTACSDC